MIGINFSSLKIERTLVFFFKIGSEKQLFFFLVLRFFLVCKRLSSKVQKNRSFTGLDEVEVRLNVLAPPSKPLGPLEISGVTPNSCKLAWKKPADDGGSQV